MKIKGSRLFLGGKKTDYGDSSPLLEKWVVSRVATKRPRKQPKMRQKRDRKDMVYEVLKDYKTADGIERRAGDIVEIHGEEAVVRSKSGHLRLTSKIRRIAAPVELSPGFMERLP